MFPPKTPKKALNADNEINSRIQSLSAAWNLELPIRDASWSPSSNPVQPIEEKIYERIKFLYWQKGQVLDNVLAEFEKQANTNWVFKRHAEPDVLPSGGAKSITRQDSFLRKRNISDNEAAELRKLLFDVLKDATDKIKAGVSHRSENTLREGGSNMLLSPRKSDNSPMAKLPRQPSISDWFVKKTPGRSALGTEPPARAQHPSSDEYPIEEESELLALDLPDAPPNIASKHPGSPGQKCRTPLEDKKIEASKATPITIPTPAPIKPESIGKPEPIFRKPQPLSAQPRNLKRSCPEAIVPSASRNVSREKRSSGFSRSHSANEIGDQMPNYNHPLEDMSDQVGNVIDTGLTRSFSSTSKTTMASSSTRPSTGFTTPNTSFHADSLATSFDSASEVDDPAITLKGIGVSHISYNALRSTSEPPSSGVAKANNCDGGENMDIEESLLETEDDETIHVNPGPVRGAAVTRIQGLGAADYLQQNLFQKSPFASFEVDEAPAVPFRQVYEVRRIATACNLPFAAFTQLLRQSVDNYEELWNSLTSIAKEHGATMPERSSTAAWKRADTSYDCVGLSGGLKFSERPGEPLLNFNLKPIKLESSYRLSRKFGGDRFCIISIPGTEPNDIPKFLRSSYDVVRPALIKWLVDVDHYFLGRKWRAFYVKPESTKKAAVRGQKKPVKVGYRVFFFAEDGKDFFKDGSTGEPDPRSHNHRPMTVSRMIDWFMPAKENQDQFCMKFFARLALAVSSTKPSVRFEPGEIIRCDDAYADKPGVRRLNAARSDQKKNRLYPVDAVGRKVMNDGCARVSKAAARDIAETLGLDTPPSVFQGRIGGAKGMWMVDALEESLPNSNRGYWIEITDSQLKFEGDPLDNLYPDPERVTFEVQSYSKKLSTAALNFQLMPILEDRGVPFLVIKRLLEEDLTAKVGDLEVAMDSTLALRKWNQDNNSVTEDRLNNKGIEMVGGLPDSLAEKINWFVEHGFDPKSCRVLKNFLYNAVKEYCMRLENKMNIELGRSTYAFMIADPLAVLEENEVHIGFSSMFRDSKSGWSDGMLHDMDILVARLPALLPSDIQKVRAVFKIELRGYTDVIMFSSKGERSLADKLSGGDFDGDRAWICWDPSIVEPFRNAAMPAAIPLATFGIEKDKLMVSDILPLQDFTSRLLLHAFDFNLRANMLGTCTSYHEAMCYHGKPISEGSAVEIAVLLGYLVDRAKAGIVFDEAQWNKYRKNKGLKTYAKPAYKDKMNANPKNHLIDNLVFIVAKSVRQDALGKFAKHFQNVGTEDEDLVRLWMTESEAAKRDSDIHLVLYDLGNKLNQIYDYWKANAIMTDDSKETTVRRGSAVSFRALAEKCRADFLAIEPLAIEGNTLTKIWKREREQKYGYARCYWDLLKASTVYQKWHKSGGFPWYIAGVELGELKATAAGKGTYRIMKQDIFEAYKLDNKVAKRRQELDYGRTMEMEEEEDEFGNFDWNDIEV